MKKEKSLKNVLDKTVDCKKILETYFAIKNDCFIWYGQSVNLSIDQTYFITITNKLFLTTIILMIRADNKLNHDDRFRMFLDPTILNILHIYKGNERSHDLTIKHLLANTSALPDSFYDKGVIKKSLADDINKVMINYGLLNKLLKDQNQ